MALSLGYATKLEEGTGRIVKPASKKDIPDAVCNPKPSLNSLCTMMVQMVTFYVSEVGVLEIEEVYRMVDPFFADVALTHAGKQHWCCIERENKAQRHRNRK